MSSAWGRSTASERQRDSRNQRPAAVRSPRSRGLGGARNAAIRAIVANCKQRRGDRWLPAQIHHLNAQFPMPRPFSTTAPERSSSNCPSDFERLATIRFPLIVMLVFLHNDRGFEFSGPLRGSPVLGGIVELLAYGLGGIRVPAFFSDRRLHLFPAGQPNAAWFVDKFRSRARGLPDPTDRLERSGACFAGAGSAATALGVAHVAEQHLEFTGTRSRRDPVAHRALGYFAHPTTRLPALVPARSVRPGSSVSGDLVDGSGVAGLGDARSAGELGRGDSSLSGRPGCARILLPRLPRRHCAQITLLARRIGAAGSARLAAADARGRSIWSAWTPTSRRRCWG